MYKRPEENHIFCRYGLMPLLKSSTLSAQRLVDYCACLVSTSSKTTVGETPSLWRSLTVVPACLQDLLSSLCWDSWLIKLTSP